jgi:uncharacterized protein YciI
MLFVISCRDKDGHSQVRQANRPAHLEHLKSHSDHIVTAGPYISDDGGSMSGSMLVVDFEDRSAAEAFAAADPYAQAGLFSSVEITAWKKVV